jgi:tripartite-type tricarboxylate transporter receptor subunit TctC
LAGLLAAAGALAPVLGFAQSYPDKPVQMIIPFDAGGNTDLMARALQEEMSRALGQPLVPINKPGAAATLGTGELARAKPDGITIGMVPIGPIAIQPNIRKLPYGPDSFDYICQTYDVPIFLMVPEDLAVQDARRRDRLRQGEPERLPLRLVRPGTMPHIATAAFLNAAGAPAPTSRSAARARWRRRCSAAPSWPLATRPRSPPRTICACSRSIPPSAKRRIPTCRP